MKLKHLSLALMLAAIPGPQAFSTSADVIRNWSLYTADAANAVHNLTSQMEVPSLASVTPPGPAALSIWGASLGFFVLVVSGRPKL